MTLILIVVAAILIVSFLITIVRKSVFVDRDEIPIDPEVQSESTVIETPGVPVGKDRLTQGRDLIRRMKSLSVTRNRYVLLVDKTAFTLYVYKNGEISARYPVELGWNPFDRKERQGDGCTPEGLYEITWKRDIGSTEFHRAFLLNYPNEIDREHGRTGGAIEIHGCGTGLRPGGGGENWTAGCIALSNECIDSLFILSDSDSRIGTGTPVGIVYAGSLPDADYVIRE